jgi:glycosyltransferase involved in cell wall biosynthesis
VAPPRITLITPVLNQAGTLAETLGSVALQGYPEVEHIIVDGGSSDGTLEMLKRSAGIDWISESDKGPYDAINKGIRRATGDIIGLLNGNDLLLPGALAAVADGFMADRTVEAACGGARLTRQHADGTVHTVRTYRSERLKRLDWYSATLGTPILNARFFRRSWYRRAGLYDARFRLTADRDFLIRSLILGMRSVPLQRVLVELRQAPALPAAASERRTRRFHDESRTLARSYLIRADSPEPLRQIARRWFSIETAHRLTVLARRQAWSEFNTTFWDAREVLPGWPVSLVREGLYRLSGGLW